MRPVLAGVFQGRAFGTIYGLIRIGSEIEGAFGPWLAGYISDVTDSYSLALVLAVVAGLAGWLCLAAVPRRSRKSLG